jgi:hypothetical protein
LMVQVHLYLMLKKIIRSKTACRNNSFVFWKLKKKWRFWRVFRFYFLRSKKKIFFPKKNWLFNQRRIIWHQLSAMYGVKIKNWAYTSNKSKVIFNSKFGSVLCKLELRLNILMTRMGFVNKLRQADSLIFGGKVSVNSVIKYKRYPTRAGDLISFIIPSLKMRGLKRLKKLRWRRFKWNKWKRQSKKNFFRRLYFLLKKNFIFNFMEINYYYCFGILLRRPLLGEIIYRNKKRLLTSRLLQKIYFLY